MKWQLALLAGIALLILMIYWRVATRPAFRQKSNEVVIREAGTRLLGQPQPVASEARTDLEFAWLSQLPINACLMVKRATLLAVQIQILLFKILAGAVG